MRTLYALFVDDPSFLFGGPPSYLDLGPFASRFAAAGRLTGGNRYRTFGRLDLELLRSYAPAAAYAYPDRIDFFDGTVGCQLEQPVFGIDLTKLCR